MQPAQGSHSFTTPKNENAEKMTQPRQTAQQERVAKGRERWRQHTILIARATLRERNAVPRDFRIQARHRRFNSFRRDEIDFENATSNHFYADTALRRLPHGERHGNKPGAAEVVSVVNCCGCCVGDATRNVHRAATRVLGAQEPVGDAQDIGLCSLGHAFDDGHTIPMRVHEKPV